MKEFLVGFSKIPYTETRTVSYRVSYQALCFPPEGLTRLLSTVTGQTLIENTRTTQESSLTKAS